MIRARADGQRSSSSARTPRRKPDQVKAGAIVVPTSDQAPAGLEPCHVPAWHDDLGSLRRIEVGAEGRLFHAVAAVPLVAGEQEHPQR